MQLREDKTENTLEIGKLLELTSRKVSKGENLSKNRENHFFSENFIFFSICRNVKTKVSDVEKLRLEDKFPPTTN